MTDPWPPRKPNPDLTNRALNYLRQLTTELSRLHATRNALIRHALIIGTTADDLIDATGLPANTISRIAHPSTERTTCPCCPPHNTDTLDLPTATRHLRILQ